MVCVYVQAQRHALWAAEEARVQQRARDRVMLREARMQKELQRLLSMEEAKKNEEERRVRRELYLSSPSEDRVKLSPLKSRFSATLPKRRCHDKADDTRVIPWDNSPASAFCPCTAAASHISPPSPMRLPLPSTMRLPLRSGPEQAAHHAHEISAQGKFVVQHEKQGKEQRPQTEETPAARGHLRLRKMEQTRAAFTSHRSKRTQLQVLYDSKCPESLHSEKTDMLWKNRVKTPELPAGAL